MKKFVVVALVALFAQAVCFSQTKVGSLDDAIETFAKFISSQVSAKGEKRIFVDAFEADDSDIADYISSGMEEKLFDSGFTTLTRETTDFAKINSEKTLQRNGTFTSAQQVDIMNSIGAQGYIGGKFRDMNGVFRLEAYMINLAGNKITRNYSFSRLPEGYGGADYQQQIKQEKQAEQNRVARERRAEIEMETYRERNTGEKARKCVLALGVSPGLSVFPLEYFAVPISAQFDVSFLKHFGIFIQAEYSIDFQGQTLKVREGVWDGWSYNYYKDEEVVVNRSYFAINAGVHIPFILNDYSYGTGFYLDAGFGIATATDPIDKDIDKNYASGYGGIIFSVLGKLGYRLPLGENRRWLIDFYARAGFPFVIGAGISLGVRF